MKNNTRNQFTYTKPDGSVSARDAFIVSSPSDSYFTIDLSEYDEDDRDAYTRALVELYEDMHYQMKEAIVDLGLSSNYRRFKAEGVS